MIVKDDYRIEVPAKNMALVAGLGLLIMAIIAPIANFGILQKLFDPSSTAATMENLTAQNGLFRLSILLFFLVALLDIIVAWALYYFLAPVNRSLSLLTAWFRMVYAAVLVVVLIYLINAAELVSHAEYLSGFTGELLPSKVMLSLNTFNQGWEFGLILFGFHLLLLGTLFLKSGAMRRILGILLIIAALGYIIDGTGRLLYPEYSASVSMVTFIGELVLIFWLLIRGRKPDPFPLVKPSA